MRMRMSRVGSSSSAPCTLRHSCSQFRLIDEWSLQTDHVWGAKDKKLIQMLRNDIRFSFRFFSQKKDNQTLSSHHQPTAKSSFLCGNFFILSVFVSDVNQSSSNIQKSTTLQEKKVFLDSGKHYSNSRDVLNPVLPLWAFKSEKSHFCSCLAASWTSNNRFLNGTTLHHHPHLTLSLYNHITARPPKIML